MGGNTIAERLAEKLGNICLPGSMSIVTATEAVRHWVTAAGYNRDGEYEYYLSSHRL